MGRRTEAPRAKMAHKKAARAQPILTGYQLPRKRSKNDDPAYRKSIWPPEKAARRKLLVGDK